MGGVQGEDGNASVPGRHSDEEAEGDGAVSATAEFEAIETAINGCSGLHGYKNVDTKIAACRVRKKKILAFAMAIHCHEVHSVHHVEEGEGGAGELGRRCGINAADRGRETTQIAARVMGREGAMRNEE